MFLFYNKSDKIIKGFGCCNFSTCDCSEYDSDVHSLYEGDFKIPRLVGDLKSQEFEVTEDQDTFVLTEFTYDTSELNICVWNYIIEGENPEREWSSVLFADMTFVNDSTITLSETRVSGDIVRVESWDIFSYLFDEETNTFSLVS